MSEHEVANETPRRAGLSAHEDARALLRLVQCPQCSRPFRSPVTLPCGNSLCRECLPQPHTRENITYPATAIRRQAFLCPYPECAEEHATADCSVDVTLTKVMESIGEVVAQHRPVTEDKPIVLEEVRRWDEAIAGQDMPEKPRSATLHGGRLIATFTLAEKEQLDYNADVAYHSVSTDGDDYRSFDEDVLQRLRDKTHKELECHVCYHLMLDPVTTFCGHTFCRKCLARVLDHSLYCPVCRRGLSIPPSLQTQPSNKRLGELLVSICPELVAARAEAVELEERGAVGELDVPLFVCTLGFPSMPTFLHIFEPRYRLMIRRALENTGQFGILMYNRHGAPQGDLGVTQFMQYGTLLQILSVQMMPDGRSLIEACGVSRFKVKAHGQLDGYTVGTIERVEDVSLAEEERLEAEETSLPPAADNDAVGLLNRLPTRQLLILGVEFVSKMQANSAPWLHQRILDAYGGPPNDPALFPYWFASILPISDDEKYKLLETTSVRERLKITAKWIRRRGTAV
ncbi:hypothetical protein LTR60_001728, partial [Cryomyces antarcticus]